MYIYKSTVIKIVDGDTVDLMVDLGFDINFKMRVRLYGINTPELRASDPTIVAKAQEAKTFVSSLLPVGKQVYIQTIKDKTEKYGRYLATIFLDEVLTVPSLNQQLIDKGLAVAYFGGKR